MPHGGFSGGPGGPGPGGFGPGMGVHGNGHFGPGVHSGSAPGFVGRGAYSSGHYNQKPNQTTSPPQPQSSQRSAPKTTRNAPSSYVNSDLSTSKLQYGATPEYVNSHHDNQQPAPPTPPKTPPRRKLHYGATTGNSPLLTRKSARCTVLVIALLSVALGCTMCMSNILATKVWAIGPLKLGDWTILGAIILDGGFILFPLTYILTDILVEICYRRIANFIVICCCFMNLLSFCALQLTAILPPAPGVMTVEPSQALSLSARVMIASSLATLASTFVNNAIYDYMRRYESSHAVSEKAIKRRAWVSSFFAHIPDSALFTFIAFSGYATTSTLIQQMSTSYLAGIVVETILLPITGKVTYSLRTSLSNIRD